MSRLWIVMCQSKLAPTYPTRDKNGKKTPVYQRSMQHPSSDIFKTEAGVRGWRHTWWGWDTPSPKAAGTSPRDCDCGKDTAGQGHTWRTVATSDPQHCRDPKGTVAYRWPTQEPLTWISRQKPSHRPPQPPGCSSPYQQCLRGLSTTHGNVSAVGLR